ncbi:MAG: single-stranded DNA-binding protein [Candidatus Nealsonbacteria bacterium]
MNLNKAFLIGRLTRDPETRALPSGQSVTSFSIATDNFYTDKSGQKQQQTEFHNIVSFGKLAEIASQYLSKGGLVLIEGRIRTRSWKDSAGNQRSRTEITAERIQLGPRSSNSKTNNSQPDRQKNDEKPQEDIPVIEEDGEINIKDIPF